jgi:GAF domain-containing protein
VNFDWSAEVRDPERLRALDRSGLVDIETGEAFDRLVELAAEVVGVRRACITVVGAEHLSRVSAVGVPEATSAPAAVELLLCRSVVGGKRPIIVDDVRIDPRTAGEDRTDEPGPGAWAGYPLEDEDGMVLGTFSLADSGPRAWSERDIHVLATLAGAASSEVAHLRCHAEAVAARTTLEALEAAVRQAGMEIVEHAEALAQLGDPASSLGSDLLERLRKLRPGPGTDQAS